MPCNYKNYPPNWKREIVPAIRQRAGNKCECCGVNNYAVGFRKDGAFYATGGNERHNKAGNGELPYKEARKLANYANQWSDYAKFIVIVLTVAHLDHNTANNDFSNLKLMCQKCHLDYDKEHHRRNAKKTNRAKKATPELFP